MKKIYTYALPCFQWRLSQFCEFAAKAGSDSYEMSHGSETLIPDVSRIPSFVIMLVSADVDAGYIATPVSWYGSRGVGLQLQPWRLFDIEMNHEYEKVLEEKRKALVSLKSSLDNFQLKTGASAAFGFVKGFWKLFNSMIAAETKDELTQKGCLDRIYTDIQTVRVTNNYTIMRIIDPYPLAQPDNRPTPTRSHSLLRCIPHLRFISESYKTVIGEFDHFLNWLFGLKTKHSGFGRVIQNCTRGVFGIRFQITYDDGDINPWKFTLEDSGTFTKIIILSTDDCVYSIRLKQDSPTYGGKTSSGTTK
nr:hypothetical protein [Tanacetum cinerariifolium]